MSSNKEDKTNKLKSQGSRDLSNKKPPTPTSIPTTADSGNRPKTEFKNREIKDSKLKPVLLGSSPGNGLMGYVKEESPVRTPLPSSQDNKQLNIKVEKQVENQLVQLLETKCSELGVEIEREKGFRKQQEIENSKLRVTISNLEKEITSLNNSIKDEKEIRGLIEKDLEEIRALYNKTKRDLGKLTQDLNYEMKTREDINSLYQDSINQREIDKDKYEKEIYELRIKIEELEEENEDLMSKMQARNEINARLEEERKNYLKEIQMKTLSENENKLEKMTKLILENADLTEKVKESESLRKKFQDKVSKQDETIKNLMENNKKLEESIQSLKKQLKDLNTAKSQGVKVFEEKIAILTSENDKLKKEISSLKKKISNLGSKAKENDNEEILEPVQAKPFLFGPVDNLKY